MMIIPPDRASRIAYAIIVPVLLAVITLLFSPFLPIGGPFGYWDAKRDLAKGILAYKVPLWDRGWEKEWKTTMQRDYGITIGGRMHSCFPSPPIDTYDRAYNRVQLAAIQQRFGSNVVLATRDKVREAWCQDAARNLR